MSDRIQEGVFFRAGETPPVFCAVALLRAPAQAQTREIRRAIAFAYRQLQALKQGSIPELPGLVLPAGRLSVLMGFGYRLFERADLAPLRPGTLRRFRAPQPGGGGTVLAGAGLPYANSVTDNPGDADVVFHLSGETALAVERAVVELWASLREAHAHGAAALSLTAAYAGHTRDDRRSWIGFFDGTSNLRSDQRLQVIAIKPKATPGPDTWAEHGTYLTFMRLRVDLPTWRGLSTVQQEILVGRTKGTGCPIVGIGPEGPLAAEGCPVAGTGSVEEPGNELFREAPVPSVAEVDLRRSHIHRANHHRQNVGDPDSRRIYRQGNEFFDGVDAAGNPVVGLNFVSFQDDPGRVAQMLTQPGWLGDTNFGGDPAAQAPALTRLLTAQAAGFFVVPPVDASAEFPGAGIFP